MRIACPRRPASRSLNTRSRWACNKVLAVVIVVPSFRLAGSIRSFVPPSCSRQRRVDAVASPCREARRGTRPMPSSCTDSASRPRRARRNASTFFSKRSRNAWSTSSPSEQRRVRRRQREHVGKRSSRPGARRGPATPTGPWLLPPSEGDADSSSPCRPSNGCGRRREVQIDQVLEDSGHGAVVFGRRDDERVARDEPSPGSRGLLAAPPRLLEIPVVERDVEVGHRRSIDVGPGALGDASRELGEPSVQRLTAQRRRENQYVEPGVRVGHGWMLH